MENGIAALKLDMHITKPAPKNLRRRPESFKYGIIALWARGPVFGDVSRAFVRAVHFTILKRRHAHRLFERAVEMIDALKAHTVTNIHNQLVGVA